MWFLCMRIERRGFYSYVCRLKLICMFVSVLALIWGNYFYTIWRKFLSLRNCFALILHSGWKLRVTAIHRHWLTRLQGVRTQKPKILILTAVKTFVSYYIKNILTVTADCILLCCIIENSCWKVVMQLNRMPTHCIQSALTTPLHRAGCKQKPSSPSWSSELTVTITCRLITVTAV